MIKCDMESGALVDGNMIECLAEFGLLAECMIEGVQEDLRQHVAMDLMEMLKTAIKRTILKGGEENEES